MADSYPTGETDSEAHGDVDIATPVQSDVELSSVTMPRHPTGKESTASSTRSQPAGQLPQTKQLSLHDLSNRYFKKPVVVFSNIDMFRWVSMRVKRGFPS